MNTVPPKIFGEPAPEDRPPSSLCALSSGPLASTLPHISVSSSCRLAKPTDEIPPEPTAAHGGEPICLPRSVEPDLWSQIYLVV